MMMDPAECMTGGGSPPRIMEELSIGVFHWFIHALVVWVNLWETLWSTLETLDILHLPLSHLLS